MSAIAEPLVSQPTHEIVFRSRREDLRLTKVQRYPIYGPGGQKVGEKPGEVIAFHRHTFACPPSGKVRLEDNRPADAAEVIAWLGEHHLNGNREEGFWRDEQPAPPITEAEQDMLMEATLDEDLARRLLEQEEAGWKRPAVVNPLRKAIARIEEMKAQLAAEAEAEAKAQAKRAPKG